MELHLDDKVALVTGGSRGLGRAICRSLAAEGAAVAVNYYRNAERGVDLADEAAAVVEEIRANCGTDAWAVPADVSREQDVAEMFRLAVERLGRIDILVNNAGICPASFIKDMSAQTWDRTIAVNLGGAFLCSRQMVRHLLGEGRKGAIVNIASQAAFKGSATGKGHYAASKAGIVALTVSLARELAPRGIRVNAVAPGMMYTQMVAESLRTREAQYRKTIPLGRIADPSETAAVVAFLASDRASYMTGATVDVSGGMLMR